MQPLESFITEPISDAAQTVVGELLTAIDRGCRLLWGHTVTGENVSSPQDLAIVLSTIVDQIMLNPRVPGDAAGGIAHATFSMVARGLCVLLNTAPGKTWDDAALLEQQKSQILEQILATYEHRVRTQVLHKKAM